MNPISPRGKGILALAASLGLCALAAPLHSATLQDNRKAKPILLHNGWKITPAGSRHTTMGDLLLGGTISPNGKWLAFVNGGAAAHQVHLADATTGAVIVSLPVERAQSTGGVAFSPNGETLYVSGGNAGVVYVFAVSSTGTLTAASPLVIAGLKSALAPKADPAKMPGVTPRGRTRPRRTPISAV